MQDNAGVLDENGEQVAIENMNLPHAVCPSCDDLIEEQDVLDCRRNQKLINFMQSEEAYSLIVGAFDSIPCPRHLHKVIEYFCKTCSESVCVKCMYDDHNGHSLVTVDEMSNSLK